MQAFFARALIGLAALCAPAAASAAPLKVFAAASLTEALDEVLAACAVGTGIESIGVYAGSGTIARQIEQGAPAALYISANPQWMDWLETRGMIAEGTRVDLLGNRMVWIGRKDAPRPPPYYLSLVELAEEMGSDRIAVADVETVPAGVYAKQVFQRFGYWDFPAFRRGLIQGSNVRDALTWVVRGEAALGVVYLTDALEADELDYRVIGDHLHDPVRYPAAVITDNDTPKARRLLTCLKGEEASKIFERFGFKLIGP